MSRHSRHDRAYHAAARRWLQDHDTCWRCGHPGADTVDHWPPQSRLTYQQRGDPKHWRPAHGVKGCPTCGDRCNQIGGTKAPEHTKRVTSRSW
jgi:hypothetical protein